jgi:hypothetical protein
VLRADYLAIASRLADPLMEEPAEPAWDKDLTQILAEGQVKVLAYQGIADRTGDKSLAFVATEAAESGAALLRAHQSMSMLSTDDGLGKLLWMGAGLWLGQPGMVVTGAEGLLTANDAYAQQKSEWLRAFIRGRAAQLMLPSIAQRCAGDSAEATGLVIDADESFAGSAPYDGLMLKNATGRDLHNVTIMVELRGAAGDVSQNVHFVPIWGKGKDRFARYGIGVETPSGPVGRQTVYGIQEVRISFWSDECRHEGMVYTYPGPERDRDIAAALDRSLKLTAAWVPTPLFGGRSLDLTLDGVALLPQHTVTLRFHHGTEVKTKTWNQREWSRGEKRRFDSGAGLLPWDPDTVDVELAFQGSNYSWHRTFTIKNGHR